MKTAISVFAMMLSVVPLCAQQSIPLYEGPIPNWIDTKDEEDVSYNQDIFIVSKISRPTLTIFKPERQDAARSAVIICPGGGYWVNAISHEGFDVAKEFNKHGVTAFVLKYRIPNDAIMKNRETGALQDIQQAIKVVRENAGKYNVDPGKVGVMGFSAGGHLASTAGTHFKNAVAPNPNKTSLRPDFMILVYPVISFMDSIGHSGSGEQIVGKKPSKEKLRLYSNELQVTSETPPAFLVHASDDDGVKPDNSIIFYQSLVKHKVPAELHIYQSGGHGFGLNNKTTDDPWFDRCVAWMKQNHWITR